MRVLILGGDGMLGHQALKHFAAKHEVGATLRQDAMQYERYGIFDAVRSYFNIDVRHTESLLGVLSDFRPQAVINGIGIVKQRRSASENIPSIEINALFPHRLALYCATIGARLVHISTDCVFSGRRGNYAEKDEPDAQDLYGRSKLLGEVKEDHCVTLRTSIIGRELARGKGLLEWFLAQRGPVPGYTRSIFSGFTTLELARIIELVLTSHTKISGIYHVSSDPISKHDLLTLVKRKLGRQTEITPDDSIVMNRTLDSWRFRRELGYVPPSWDAMIEELAWSLSGEPR